MREKYSFIKYDYNKDKEVLCMNSWLYLYRFLITFSSIILSVILVLTVMYPARVYELYILFLLTIVLEPRELMDIVSLLIEKILTYTLKHIGTISTVLFILSSLTFIFMRKIRLPNKVSKS